MRSDDDGEPPVTTPIKLVVVDDHQFVRLGVQHHFARQPDIAVVAALGSPGELDALELDFDVLLLDLYFGDCEHSLDAIKQWARTKPVLIMSYSGKPLDVMAAVQAGASGYLTKDAPVDAFADAVREVARGGFAWSTDLADIVEQWLNRSATTRAAAESLSDREREVLTYLARGYTHRQIASRMTVAQSTVDTYVKRIRSKLRLGNKADLTRSALEQGLVLTEE